MRLLLERKAAYGNLELVIQCINTTLSRFTSDSMLSHLQKGKALQTSSIQPSGGPHDTRKPGERKTINERIDAGEPIHMQGTDDACGLNFPFAEQHVTTAWL